MLAFPIHNGMILNVLKCDCRSVSDDDILDGDDYVYFAASLHFPKSMEKPSHDKHFHVCYGSGMLNGKIEYHPLCIYTRQGF